MHPTRKFVCRHQHDLTSAQVRTPADIVSHRSQGYSRVTVGSEDAAALEASCSNRTVFLYLSGCSSPASGPVDVSHSVLFVLVLYDVTARCVRMSNRHLLVISVSMGTSPAPRSTRALFVSLTRPVSAILSLYAPILTFPVKVLSMIVLILSRNSSLCGFVAFPCDASAAHPGRQPPVCP